MKIKTRKTQATIQTMKENKKKVETKRKLILKRALLIYLKNINKALS